MQKEPKHPGWQNVNINLRHDLHMKLKLMALRRRWSLAATARELIVAGLAATKTK